MKKNVIIVEAIIYKKVYSQVYILQLLRVPGDGGFWQPLTGTLDNNEEILSALKREIFEESGITNIISISDQIHTFCWESETKNAIEYAFAVEVASEVKIILNPDEHSAFKWTIIDDTVFPMPENQIALNKLKLLL